MTADSSAGRRTRLDLPPWIWGSDPPGLLQAAGLKGWPAGGNAYQVQTREAYLRSSARLISVDHIAGPELSKARFDVIGAAAATERVLASEAAEPTRVARAFAAIADRVDVSAAVAAHQIQLLISAPSEVQALVEQEFAALRVVVVEEKPDLHPFAEAGVHLLRRQPALLVRMKLPSILLHFPDAQADPTGLALRAREQSGASVFSTSDRLGDGHLLFDAYTAPLLGALTPFVWAFAVHRDLGVIIYSLGSPIAGTRGEAAEPLQLLSLPSATRGVPAPRQSPGSAGAALRWWAERLDRMFAVLSDPVVFSTGGRYDPARHLHMRLTVDQLFRRVASIQASHRDLHARRVLLFSALDTLERLTNRNLEHQTSLRLSEAAAESLREDIPSNAAEILLPAVDRAIDALREVQAGFGAAAASGIVVLDDTNGPRQVGLDAAASLYLKMLRNATHGHGGKDSSAERVTSLLRQHTGVVSHDLGLLAYLWLLDLLRRPEDLRTTLTRGS